jgi:hypothetical protein
MRFISMVCAVALATPLVSSAQFPTRAAWPPDPGSRVRIVSSELGEHSQTLTVVSATHDALVVRQGSDPTRSVQASGITRLEVASGTHTNKARGALIGFAGGLVGGAILGAAKYKPCRDSFACIGTPDFGRGGSAAFGAELVGIVGALVGTVIGTVHTDTWTRVAVPEG